MAAAARRVGALSAERLIANSDAFLKELQIVRTANQRLVNALMFNGQFPDRQNVVQPGIYGKLRRGEAAWNYLFLAGVPQTTGQVMAAVGNRGNCRSKAKDPYKATYQSLSRSEKFKRFGTHHWVIAT